MSDLSPQQHQRYSTRLQQFLAVVGVHNTDVVNEWLQHCIPRHYAKSEIICASGSLVKFFAIIDAGLVRAYYQSHSGKEWNKDFFTEGNTAVAASAYLTDTKAPFTLQALEPTTLITTTKQSMNQLRKKYDDFNRILNRLITNAFIRNEQREAVLLTLNAPQRYAWLQQNHADLLQRLPQFHLASFLGIDAVSLSRIKSKYDQ